MYIYLGLQEHVSGFSYMPSIYYKQHVYKPIDDAQMHIEQSIIAGAMKKSLDHYSISNHLKIMMTFKNFYF